MKKLFVLLLTGALLLSAVPAFAQSGDSLNIVATIYPQYDFARAVAGDVSTVNLTMLLRPGAEMHSYEPTPQDIIAIRNADLFLYVGGESDAWVAEILASMPDSGVKAMSLTEMVPTLAEELVEGMQPEEEEASSAEGETESEAPEMDEHVWTAPLNALSMVNAIAAEMSAMDPANAAAYQRNAAAYGEKLSALDAAFREVVAGGKRTELIFGDRFPMRYFTHAYGLTYYAAFPGCSNETEPSAQTVAFLMNKVKQDKVPLILYPELSTHKVADVISEETGVPSHVFYACHNLTADEFAAGKTYVDFMTDNLATLKEALN